MARPLSVNGQSLFVLKLCRTLPPDTFSTKDGCGYPEPTVLRELEGSHVGAGRQQVPTHIRKPLKVQDGRDFVTHQPQLLSVMGMWHWACPQTHSRVWGDCPESQLRRVPRQTSRQLLCILGCWAASPNSWQPPKRCYSSLSTPQAPHITNMQATTGTRAPVYTHLCMPSPFLRTPEELADLLVPSC